MNIISRLWARILARFRKPEPKANPLTLQRQSTREVARENGAYIDFAQFLNDLDERFDRLDRTKIPRYREGAGHGQILKATGAWIMGDDTLFRIEGVDPYVMENLPDSLLYSFPRDEGVLGDWLYLVRRDEHIPNVEIPRRDEARYSVDVITAKWKNIPSLFSCLGYFAVARDMKVRELRYRIEDRFGRKGGWRYSPLLEEHDDASERKCQFFNIGLSIHAMRFRHWVVVATDGQGRRMHATIPDNDAPRFFRKADKVGGSRTFHSVAAHVRSNGAAVKTHYRGSRTFRYKGYRIDVLIPGFSKREAA